MRIAKLIKAPVGYEDYLGKEGKVSMIVGSKLNSDLDGIWIDFPDGRTIPFSRGEVEIRMVQNDQHSRNDPGTARR